MKLTTLFLIAGFLQVHANGISQTVTLSAKNIEMEQVFAQVKKQTGYVFFFDKDLVKEIKPLSIEVSNMPLDEFLAKLFKDTPLKYSIKNKAIVVSRKERSAVSPDPRNANLPAAPSNTEGEPADTDAAFAITGIVFNQRFEPLGNASVVVRGTQEGTLTNANGTFTLPAAKKGDVLRVSYIGYQTADFTVSSVEKPITIVLKDAVDELDEVVAQGYSKTTKRLSTSSVAKVSGEEVARQPVMDPLLALQGKVPGMVITPVSTFNGGPVVIDIRGRGLLSQASENPLIVIDGIPMNVGSNQGVALGDGPVQGLMAVMSPAGSQSMLFGLNPRDIESIEILKDVGATAIYGSLGANGVILITTKRGAIGASNLDVNVNFGLSKVMRYYDLLNTPQYLEMRREALRNDGLIPSVINAPDLMLWDTTRYTDWQRMVWGRAAATMNATVSYSGGTQNFTHRISANYSRPQNISWARNRNETMGINIALDRKSDNRKFSTALTISYMHTFLDMINAPSVHNLPPNAPPIFDSSGNLNYKDWAGTGFESVLDGFGVLFRPIESRTNSLNAGLRVSYQLAKGLNLLSNFTYRMAGNNGWNLTPIRSQNPSSNPTGSSVFTKSESRGWSFEPQLTYDGRLFGKGRLGLTAGATIRSDMRESISSMAMGFTNDATLRALSLAAFVGTEYASAPYKYAGIMGRVEYVWDNKYVVNGIWRRDGSSRFGPGRRFGNFGSLGVAWIASDEKWLKKLLHPAISFLKFNANIGTAGSDGGGDYQYLSQWSRARLANYDNVAPMTSLHAVNQFYQWQLTRELNAGMQVSFTGTGKLRLNVNYYRSRVGNQLTDNPTPIFTGFSSVFGNWNATVQNSGWEMNLSASLINKKNFTWTASVNAGFNRNKLLEYPQIEKTPHFSLYRVGESINTKYLLRYMGVDPMTGSYQYEDYNKDGIINSGAVLPPLTAPSDKQMIVDITPVVTGGISQTFTYKNATLFIGFDYAVQKGTNAFFSFSGAGRLGNIPLEIFNNRWQKPGDDAKYARFTTGSGQNYPKGVSTIFYTDASFLRFNNISFSYRLPDKLLRRVGMKQCSFNINTRNIFTISRYEGVDPEVKNFSGMPPARTITFGFSANI